MTPDQFLSEWKSLLTTAPKTLEPIGPWREVFEQLSRLRDFLNERLAVADTEELEKLRARVAQIESRLHPNDVRIPNAGTAAAPLPIPQPQKAKPQPGSPKFDPISETDYGMGVGGRSSEPPMSADDFVNELHALREHSVSKRRARGGLQ